MRIIWQALTLFTIPLLTYASPDGLNREIEILTVKAKLAAMVAEDQAIRMGSRDLLALGYSFKEVLENPKLIAASNHLDIANTEQLKKFVQQWGWISVSKFGLKANDNAWLLAQHADHDVAFQEDTLARITHSLPNDDTQGHMAYLWDRVKVNRGLPQRYGTQGKCNEQNRWVPMALEDQSRLDEFRAAVGLSKFSEYLKIVSPMCKQ